MILWTFVNVWISKLPTTVMEHGFWPRKWKGYFVYLPMSAVDHWLLLSFACDELQFLVLIYFLQHRTSRTSYFIWRKRVWDSVQRVESLAECSLLDAHTWFLTCFSSGMSSAGFLLCSEACVHRTLIPIILIVCISPFLTKCRDQNYAVALWSWFYQWHMNY